MGRPRVPIPWWICGDCGGRFQRHPYGKTPKFCSRECAGRSNQRLAPTVGPLNGRYNGGLCLYRGRWLICCRDGTTMQFARGVMAARLGRLLTSQEIVHHVNGDPLDDRAQNLRLVTRAEHIEIHRDELLAARGIYRDGAVAA